MEARKQNESELNVSFTVYLIIAVRMSFVHAQSKHGANRQESDAHELTEYVLDKMASTGNREQQGVTHGSWCKSQDEDKKSLASVKSRNFILDRAPSFATFGTNDDAHFATSSSKDGGPYCTWNYDQQSKDVTLSERELSSIMRKIDFRLIPVLMFIFFYTICELCMTSYDTVPY
jgi:hypothetical protein